MIKHYRVDKMLHIRMSDEPREGKEHFRKLDCLIRQQQANRKESVKISPILKLKKIFT